MMYYNGARMATVKRADARAVALLSCASLWQYAQASSCVKCQQLLNGTDGKQEPSVSIVQRPIGTQPTSL